jgi:DNA-binding transcriptional LysR family regulator
MDELTALRVFTRVVECGSFSAAARELALRPSSVSRQIAALETRLSVVLIQRSTRTMSLTEAGRLYFSHCQRLLKELHHANRIVKGLQESAQGQLVIETRAGLGARLLAPVLPDFLAQHPRVKLHLRLTDQTNDTLPHGVDVAIRFGLGRHSSLICRKIMPTRRVMFASPSYLRSHGEPQSPAELFRHNCLAFPTTLDGETTWRFCGPSGRSVWPVQGNLVANDVSTLIAAAVAGLGISVMHEWMVWKELESGQLTRIMTGFEVSTLDEFDTPIYVVYPPGRQPAKVKCFIDFLSERLGAGRGEVRLEKSHGLIG